MPTARVRGTMLRLRCAVQPFRCTLSLLLRPACSSAAPPVALGKAVALAGAVRVRREKHHVTWLAAAVPQQTRRHGTRAVSHAARRLRLRLPGARAAAGQARPPSARRPLPPRPPPPPPTTQNAVRQAGQELAVLQPLPGAYAAQCAGRTGRRAGLAEAQLQMEGKSRRGERQGQPPPCWKGVGSMPSCRCSRRRR
jgi:hypothetical protein